MFLKKEKKNCKIEFLVDINCYTKKKRRKELHAAVCIIYMYC